MEYKTSASVIPEYELQDRVNEIIESYGLLFGLTGSIRENRTPSYLLELYPFMISSISFQRTLMHKAFRYEKRDTTITLYDYFTDFYHPSVMTVIHKYTLGLPSTIMGGTTAPPEILSNSVSDSAGTILGPQFEVLHLNRSEKKVISQLSPRIIAGYERRTGIVRVSAKMPDPKLAAIVVRLTLEVLHEKAVAYKTEKGRLYKHYLQTQLNRAKKELDQARKALLDFNNSNDQQLLNERLELQSNYEAALDQFSALNQQLSRITLNIQEQIPAFRILDDITVPNQKSEPKRKLILMFSLLLGICIALSWISVAFFTSKIKEPAAADKRG